MRVDGLRQVYPDFNRIYYRSVNEAKFDVVKGQEFQSLKERLITVLHLLEKHPQVGPGKRAELIQAVLSEDNIRRAQRIFPPKSDKTNQSGKTSSLWSIVVGLFSGSKETDEESLRSDVKKKKSVSDSDFLLQLKRVDDKDLEAAIQMAVDLACTQLSSSIDAAVKKMTHRVLQMQQDECKKCMQREIEAEERKEVGGKLADFIHAINEVSARRRTS
jgi:hypothetical protein